VRLESCSIHAHHIKLNLHRIILNKPPLPVFRRNAPRLPASPQQALQINILPPPPLPPHPRLLPPPTLDRAPACARQPHALRPRVRARARPLRREEERPCALGLAREVVARDGAGVGRHVEEAHARLAVLRRGRGRGRRRRREGGHAQGVVPEAATEGVDGRERGERREEPGQRLLTRSRVGVVAE
jgi:hypothetical protein